MKGLLRGGEEEEQWIDEEGEGMKGWMGLLRRLRRKGGRSREEEIRI